MRNLFIPLAVLAMAGCATQESGLVGATAPTVVASSTTVLTPESKLVCHRETSTGSNMIHTVCESEQSAADRNGVQEQLRNMAPPNAVAHPAVGGH